MDLLKKLFMLTLFLFPIGEVLRIYFGYGVIVRPLDVGVGVLVLSWLIFKIIKKQKVKHVDILLPILLFFSIGLFSLIVNNLQLATDEFFISFSYLLRWIIYSGLFFVASDFDKNFKEKISNVLVIIGSLIVGFGYFQYFFYSSLKSLSYLGWDDHMYRMFSVFMDPNFAGTFFVLFFLFLVDIFLRKKNILIILLAILTLGAVFLTFSRSALIMLIVSSGLLFVLMNKKIWIAILLGLIILVLTISSRYFNIENINLFRTVSSEARLETTRNAITIIIDHPVFGIGFNAYRYAQFHYGFRNDKSRVASHADTSPDNSFLFIIATTGLMGFAISSLLWFRITKYAIKSNPLLLSSVAGVFISSLFINSLFYPFVAMWLWIIIAVKESS